MLPYLILTAIIELFLVTAFRDKLNARKEDPNALSYTAFKDYDETLGYFPGMSYYDEKHGRYVTTYRYKWEYLGKTHKVMFTDDPFNQWEHYLSTFPDEISVTINRKTGKLYKDKGERSVTRKYLLTLLASFVIAAIVMFALPAVFILAYAWLS